MTHKAGWISSCPDWYGISGKKKLFADQKRLIVKDYPKYAGDSLKKAGFIHEMQDYVLYWP